MSKFYHPAPDIIAKARIDDEHYRKLYAESIAEPEKFWFREGQRLDWIKPYTEVKSTSFQLPSVSIKWFEDGVLNVCANCVDRHAKRTPDRTALIWESDNGEAQQKISYGQLLSHVSRMANVLRSLDVGKGDRVVIYMPMIPEAAYAMLACARIGAVHSVVFGGFSATALAGRIIDCAPSLVVTADAGVRGGKIIPLKQNVDAAVAIAAKQGLAPHKTLVFKATGIDSPFDARRDVWHHDKAATVDENCPPEPMNAEDPLFILYTSGSTGKPKGVLHTSGGYLVYASITHDYVFDYRQDDIYWCTADVGWITGHSYIVYGPLANGATTLMFEGVPHYPDPGRFWQIIDKHQVSLFYTAPTAIRALIREGDSYVKRASRRSLRVLGSVGEPINPEAWLWYHRVVGEGRCPIVDTWWQTETGGILISPLPGATPTKPGSATRPFFGIKPVLVDRQNKPQADAGMLCLDDSWPGQMRTVFGDHQRFVDTYFTRFPGRYFSGDGACRDEDGYYWITGRVDDVINVAGHRFGTAEIESAFVAHAAVAEAAVVGYPHDVKGQGICAFVLLKQGVAPSPELHSALKQQVRQAIGSVATPDLILFPEGLPKTRSGKIMRRILRKVAEGEVDDLGDTSTLADASVVGQLITACRQSAF